MTERARIAGGGLSKRRSTHVTFDLTTLSRHTATEPPVLSFCPLLPLLLLLLLLVAEQPADGLARAFSMMNDELQDGEVE